MQAGAIDALPEAHRQLILNLSVHDEAANFSHHERVEKITSTNASDIDWDPDEVAGDDEGEDEDPDRENGFYVVFLEIARMNHDCRPAADYYFDAETPTQYVHAVRPIQPGEEITITYIDPTLAQARRARKLHRNWGFRCACASCTAPPAVVASSDDRLRQVARLRPEFGRIRRESRATPQMAELLVGLYEQERLWGMLYEAYRLVRARVERRRRAVDGHQVRAPGCRVRDLQLRREGRARGRDGRAGHRSVESLELDV